MTFIIYIILALLGFQILLWFIKQMLLARIDRNKRKCLFKRPLTIETPNGPITTFSYTFYIGRNQVGTDNYKVAQMLQLSFPVVVSTSENSEK